MLNDFRTVEEFFCVMGFNTYSTSRVHRTCRQQTHANTEEYLKKYVLIFFLSFIVTSASICRKISSNILRVSVSNGIGFEEDNEKSQEDPNEPVLSVGGSEWLAMPMGAGPRPSRMAYVDESPDQGFF